MKALFTGRWIAFTAVCIVAFGVLLALAQWQWSSAQDKHKAPPSAVSPIDQTVTLEGGVSISSVGSLVSASGVYDAGKQLRVVGQRVAGTSVDWVVTPLRETSGVLVTVVRGFVVAGAPLPKPPTGTVGIVGTLQASDQSGALYDPPRSVSTYALASLWNTRLRDGYVVVRHSQPPQSGVTTIPAGALHVHRGIPVWRNVAYAIQWLLFAGFVVFFWYRSSRDQLRARGTDTLPGPVGEDGTRDPIGSQQQADAVAPTEES